MLIRNKILFLFFKRLGGMSNLHKNLFILGTLLLLLNAGMPCKLHAQNEKKFTVVIDPGHGGKDTGTPGTGKYRTAEKDIVLAVAKRVRDLLRRHPDIRVIMTRTSDKFLGLRRRAEIANKHKADVFVSIHCNASTNPRAAGSETFVLGVHRNKDNLEVAKRENAVILLEDDYQLHYEGFDPNAPETFIGLEILQEEFLEQSILLASMLQREYEKRVATKNRSVQQAGFAVLRLTYMPSILTEIGFLTNPQEEKMLRSAAGQEKIALSIANAVVRYKDIIRQNSTDPTSSVNQKEETAQNTSSRRPLRTDVFYTVQIKSSVRLIPLKADYFKGIKPTFYQKIDGVYKYFYGQTRNWSEAKNLLHKARSRGFADAFIVGFKNGKRVGAAEVKKILNP